MVKIKKHIATTKIKWQQASVHDRIIVVSTLAYITLVSGFVLWHRVFFSPDRFFILVLIAMLIAGKATVFFWDWLPPILLILGYEYLRGLVPHLTQTVNIYPMIWFDEKIFGTIPTIALQHRLFNPAAPQWYDYLLVVIYFVHFIVPLFLALIFWFFDRQYFKRYMTAMVVLSYFAFITYYFFPAMPPWMASNEGFIAPVQRIMDIVMSHFGYPTAIPSLYRFFSANLVAAVPSLHAAYPLLTLLFLHKKWPRASYLFIVYVLAVWFAIIYLGEHYVFDLVAAIVYALMVYVVMVNWKKIRSVFADYIPKRRAKS